MKYGLIGEKLPHSFSKEIHESIANYSYELCELTPAEIDSFMKNRDFSAINVTIPYKETVIPYLDNVDPVAAKIGAVNTVVNRGGKLYGYNTDFYGMSALICKLKLELADSKVLILGTGGTSKTARTVCEDMGAAKIITVSRKVSEGHVTYEDAIKLHGDADFIINTTPCGMFPHQNDTEDRSATPIDVSRFKNLRGVVDAVYNPLRTNLVLDALERGITAEGGLYMLVAQAVRACEIFTSREIDPSVMEKAYKSILSSKENVILTGMPGSGKSSVGREISASLGRRFVDSDDVIVEIAGKTIPEIFSESGESEFRRIETEAIRKITSEYTGAVIATGGGAILKDENVRMLRRCGRLFFINRPIEQIIPTKDRPLSSDYEALKRRFDERYGRYLSTCDYEIKSDNVRSHTVEKIISLL